MALALALAIFMVKRVERSVLKLIEGKLTGIAEPLAKAKAKAKALIKN